MLVFPPRGKLNGCCPALGVAFAAMEVAGGCCMFVGCGCLQRTAAAGVAWHLSVQCGTASKDGTCGIGIMGRLGLQRTAAGSSAWLAIRCGTSSKDGTSNVFSLMAWRQRSCARVKQVGEVGLRWWLSIDGVLGTWGNIAHHPDGSKGNGTVAWSIVTGVARSPRVVILRGDESEVQRQKW
jgi:hypothetical protein